MVKSDMATTTKRFREWQRNLEKFENEVLVPVNQKMGVLCLTACQRNILMFSHYAESHQGFCLGFSTRSVLFEPFYFAPDLRWTIKVAYPGDFERPSFFSRDKHEWVRWRLATKSPLWNYEEEYRVVDHGGARPVAFSPPMLKEIIFGCRMTDEHIEKLLALTKDWPTPISYFRARKRYDAIALKLEPFTP